MELRESIFYNQNQRYKLVKSCVLPQSSHWVAIVGGEHRRSTCRKHDLFYFGSKTFALKHPCFPRIYTSETPKSDSTPKDLDSGELKHFRVSLPPKFTVQNATKTGGKQNSEKAKIRFSKFWFWKIEDFPISKIEKSKRSRCTVFNDVHRLSKGITRLTFPAISWKITRRVLIFEEFSMGC